VPSRSWNGGHEERDGNKFFKLSFKLFDDVLAQTDASY